MNLREKKIFTVLVHHLVSVLGNDLCMSVSESRLRMNSYGLWPQFLFSKRWCSSCSVAKVSFQWNQNPALDQRWPTWMYEHLCTAFNLSKFSKVKTKQFWRHEETEVSAHKQTTKHYINPQHWQVFILTLFQTVQLVSVFMFFPICRLYINAIQQGSHLEGLQYTILK